MITNLASRPPIEPGYYVGLYGGDPIHSVKLYWDGRNWKNLAGGDPVFGPGCGPDGADDLWRLVSIDDSFDALGRLQR